MPAVFCRQMNRVFYPISVAPFVQIIRRQEIKTNWVAHLNYYVVDMNNSTILELSKYLIKS